MNIIQEIIQWFIQNADQIQQIHDNTVDELARYSNLYVAYHQVREIRNDENEERPTAPEQENSVDPSDGVDNNNA
ncbi:hypothetical protein QYF50_07230 [Paenibacillus vini]|uniref:hypothetical protein n=1 Tax=Paenibacillus vini TaxID=1476024 RepID=UPI0025B6EED2|nr:hypothetical protein [Paenibacillus vini]MDN4067684.1 hypothetical protein [Paenibacillus vini]